jgi:dUTPase
MGAEEMEMKTEEVVVEEVEMAKEEEVVVETEMAVEMPTDAPVEAYTKAEMDAKFDEIYAMIAELKTGTATEMAVEEVEMAEAPKSGIELKMSKVEKLSNFINKK